MKPTRPLLKIIMPIAGIICAVLFVPWMVIRAWVLPLPDTVQEQVDDAIEHADQITLRMLLQHRINRKYWLPLSCLILLDCCVMWTPQMWSVDTIRTMREM